MDWVHTAQLQTLTKAIVIFSIKLLLNSSDNVLTLSVTFSGQWKHCLRLLIAILALQPPPHLTSRFIFILGENPLWMQIMKLLQRKTLSRVRYWIESKMMEGEWETKHHGVVQRRNQCNGCCSSDAAPANEWARGSQEREDKGKVLKKKKSAKIEETESESEWMNGPFWRRNICWDGGGGMNGGNEERPLVVVPGRWTITSLTINRSNRGFVFGQVAARALFASPVRSRLATFAKRIVPVLVNKRDFDRLIALISNRTFILKMLHPLNICSTWSQLNACSGGGGS